MNPALVFVTLAALIQVSPRETFDVYLTALKANDLSKAISCWTDEAILESGRLGIVFTDVSPKYDNASVVVTHIAALRKGEATVSCGAVTPHNGWAELPVIVKSGRDSVLTTYYFEEQKGEWKISAPLFIHSRGWKTRNTRYTELHYRDSTLLNDYAIEKLDSFIYSVSMKMGMSEDRQAGLQQVKIPYYLGDKDDVKALTGFETFGMTNLQFDAVVTQYLPHPHELTHLLIDYVLKEQPLYTLPFLQEGLACCFGGRWGKSVAVIDQMGCYLLENEVVQLDSVLTWRGFYQSVGMSDLTYPVSSEFVGFLIEEGGFEKFLEFYRAGSGTPDSLMKLTVKDIHESAELIYGTKWPVLMTQFEEYRKQRTFSGLEPGGEMNGVPIIKLEEGGNSVKVCDGENAYTVKCRLTKPGEFVTLVLTMLEQDSTSYKSKLFAEHFPGSQRRGEISGIRFNSREAGFYDYRTNTLEAKYVMAFNPSESYWDEKDETVTFRIAKGLISGKIERYRFELK